MQVSNVYICRDTTVYYKWTYTDAFSVYEQVFVWYEARAEFFLQDLTRGPWGAWKRLTLGPTSVQH